MNEEKKDKKTNDQPADKQGADKKMSEPQSEPQRVSRQIIIETDGTNVKLIKNETAGKIELIGVLQSLTQFLMNNK